MRELEFEIGDMKSTLGSLMTAVAELLTWAREAEQAGSVSAGSLDRAQRIVELGKLNDELSLVSETLEEMESMDTPNLQLRLAQRVDSLRSRIGTITEELDGSTA